MKAKEILNALLHDVVTGRFADEAKLPSEDLRKERKVLKRVCVASIHNLSSVIKDLRV